MLIGCSDLIRLNEPPDKNIELLVSKYKLEMIELMMEGISWWEDPSFWQEALKQQIKQMGIKISLHPPTTSMDLSCDSLEIRLFGVNEHLKAIKLAGELKAEHVVIHPGFCCANPENRAAALERSFDSLERLLKTARYVGIKLAIENVGWRQYGSFSLDEYCRFLEYFNPREVVSLIDVGHAFLNRWSFSELFQRLGNRLHALHLHDNNGIKDQHLPIGQGELPWEEIWLNLWKAPAIKYLILEYSSGTPLLEILNSQNIIKSQYSAHPNYALK